VRTTLGIPENSDNAPVGEYAETCGGCTFNDTTLACTHCEMPMTGERVFSTIDTATCEYGVVNKDGTLACKPAPLPPGSYQDSCSSCSVVGTTLKCEHCRDGSGIQFAPSELAHVDECTAVGNADGTLECQGKKPSKDEL
jgi:hypothetical protein